MRRVVRIPTYAQQSNNKNWESHTQTHPISGGDFTSLRRDAAQGSNKVTEGDFIKGPTNE